MINGQAVPASRAERREHLERPPGQIECHCLAVRLLLLANGGAGRGRSINQLEVSQLPTGASRRPILPVGGRRQQAESARVKFRPRGSGGRSQQVAG